MAIRAVAVVIAAALCAQTAAAASRIAFERTIPAPQNPSAVTDFALVYAIGDNDRIKTFLDSFIDQTNRSGTVRLNDATSENVRNAMRTRFPADLYIRVTAFTCRTSEQAGEGGAYDPDGKRIRRRQRWVDAGCTARVELIDADSRARVATFSATGEGTSPRELDITPDITAVALDQAARYAGVAAAEQITPRRVKESILLIEEAPDFAQGMAMIESGRLEEARRIWTDALRRNPDSAPLHFNLAAVCEALGDVPAAVREYEAVRTIAPAERRYRAEFEMFRRRNGIRK
jgi:hypothetical protein